MRYVFIALLTLCSVASTQARTIDRDVLAEFDLANQECPVATTSNYETTPCKLRRYTSIILTQRGWCYGRLDPDFKSNVWRTCP